MPDAAESGGVIRSHTRSSRASPALLLAALGLGVFIGTFDQTVVVTILPNIISDIGLPVSHFGEATWIVNGYLLGYTVAMPVVGRLADVYGHVRLYLICLGIFIAGSAAVALAPNLGVLVAARTFQAIGGGGVLPVAFAIAADVLPKRQRPLAFGAFAAANNASSLLGPLWGAAITSVLGWRGVFWLNIPLILPVLLLLPLLARESGESKRLPVDWTGGALLAAGISLGAIALTDDGAHPRPLAISLALGGAALIALAAFAWREWHAQIPMIQLRSFRRPPFTAAMLIYFLIGGALITALVDVPLMTDLLFGGSALQGGLNLMRLLLFLPLGGVIGGWLCTRTGYRALAVTGLLAAIAGFLLMWVWPSSPSSLDLWLSLGLLGFGLGLCDAPVVSTVIETAGASERATSSALLLVVWTSGMITGLALLGTQGLGSFTSGAARLFRQQGVNLKTAALNHLMRQTFNSTLLFAALALVFALGLALFLESRRSKTAHWSALSGLEEWEEGDA